MQLNISVSTNDDQRKLTIGYVFNENRKRDKKNHEINIRQIFCEYKSEIASKFICFSEWLCYLPTLPIKMSHLKNRNKSR